MFYVLGHQRRVALANLAIAFPDQSPAEHQRIARQSFANAFGTVMTMFWTGRSAADEVGRYVDNAEEFRRFKAHENGHGLILLTLHYGDWELLGLASGASGLPVTVVARELPNRELARRLTALRALTGNVMIPQHRAVQRLFQALRRGETAAMLADLNARRETGGVWVNFFGLPVFNHNSVAALAVRTGAPICLLIAEPLPQGRVRIHNGGLIKYQPTGAYEQDVQRLSQLCADASEAAIRARPELWLWSYRRWRHRPTPAQGRYPFYSSYKDMGISPPA